MPSHDTHEFTNRLIHEKSPYLLQHAHNPVDWYPWCQEALSKAQIEDKPILVSIGYATCHWCHVMERESFEDPAVARYLNQHFVPIKVDREERPDVDRIYMDALQALRQHGGWPLNMFLTPEGKPFTGGTYFPPEQRHGLLSFRQVLETIQQYWQNSRDEVLETAEKLSEHLATKDLLPSGEHQISLELEDRTSLYFHNSFDPTHGGFTFQQRNKFPPSMGLMLLMRHYKRTQNKNSRHMVELTLQKMMRGGIYDQIGGGLSRYSTDHHWLVPHFEKMLYDNSLLVWALVEAWQLTHNDYYHDSAQDILNYIERDMLSPEGAFYSAEDADSEGVEGKFYVWSQQEILEVLGEELGRLACNVWGVSPAGNWEGHNILNLPKPLAEQAETLQMPLEDLKQNLEEARQRLLTQRDHRQRPLLDDKILTSWNGLMISAFCRAARAFGNPTYIRIAQGAMQFILHHLVDENGRLLRRYREGDARYPAYLTDYTSLATACLDLYETTYNLDWFAKSVHWANEINRLFRNEDGPYFDTGADAEKLITRTTDGYDGVEPSGNSTLALLFLKLHAYGVAGTWHADAMRVLNHYYRYLEGAGISFSAMMWAVHWELGTTRELVLCGKSDDPQTEAMIRAVHQRYEPNLITCLVPPDQAEAVQRLIPLAQGRAQVNDQPTAYLCQNRTCQQPVHTVEELVELLEG